MFGHAHDKIIWRVGSVMSPYDMDRIEARSAAAFFFLSYNVPFTDTAVASDRLIALQVLGVQSYSAELEVLAQISMRKNRKILCDSKIDVVVTLDEYSASLSARNALCPGFITLMENLITTVSIFENVNEKPWEKEYMNGMDKEFYYIEISDEVLREFGYEFSLLSEAIFLHFDIICMGMCDINMTEAVLNPTFLEINEISGGNKVEFYKKYPVSILLADTHMAAVGVSCVNLESHQGTLHQIMTAVFDAEMQDSFCEYPMKSKVGVEESNRDIKSAALIDRTNKLNEVTRRYTKENTEKSGSSGGGGGNFFNFSNIGVGGEFEIIHFPVKTNLDDLKGHIILIGVIDDLPVVLRELRRDVLG